MNENHLLTEKIREQLIEYGNYIIQRRVIKTSFGRIRSDMFSLVTEANHNFDILLVHIIRI